MDMNGIIDNVNKLSGLGTTAILLVILGGLAWFVWRENEERKKNDDILDRLEDSLSRIATATEHQNKIFEWMREDSSRCREANAKLKDDIHTDVKETLRIVMDVKSVMLSGIGMRRNSDMDSLISTCEQ